jgi:anti-sigma-K factor RskA
MNDQDYIESGIVEQYVLGLCTVQEKAEIEMKRMQNAALHNAIIEFEILFEKQMNSNQLLTELNAENIFTKKHDSSTLKMINAKLLHFKLYKIAAAVAFLLLVVSVYLNYWQLNKSNQIQLALKNTEQPTLPLSDYNILKDPAITPVAMYGVGYHSICRCTMFWDKNTKKVYIMIHHLPKSNSKQGYQLWANVNGKQISIGIINDAIRDRFIELNGVPDKAASFIVTLENSKGVIQPTIDETYLKGII